MMGSLTPQAIGNQYERLAGELLLANGCQIIKTNYGVPNVGEIDIIARCDKALPNGRIYPTLLCVEVRARRVGNFASASASITKAKRQCLIATMSHFLQTNPDYANFDVRFDVIAFDIGRADETVAWLKGAFLAE